MKVFTQIYTAGNNYVQIIKSMALNGKPAALTFEIIIKIFKILGNIEYIW